MLNLNPTKLLCSFAGLVVVAILAGCASGTLTREECISADWYQIGLTDGQAGYEISRLDAHRDACSDTPALINELGYRNGRETGLAAYCVPSTGYSLGQGGATYSGVCSTSSEEPTFLQAYALGQEAYRSRADVTRAEQNIAGITRDLEERQQLLTSLEAMPAASRTAGHRQQLQQMLSETAALRERLADAQLALESARNWQINIEADTRARLNRL